MKRLLCIAISCALSSYAIAETSTVSTDTDDTPVLTELVDDTSALLAVIDADISSSDTAKPVQTLVHTSRSFTNFGIVNNFVQLSSISKPAMVVLDDLDGDYISVIALLKMATGLDHDDETKVHAIAHESYVSCKNNTQYQKGFMLFDASNKEIESWHNKKTSITKTDFLPVVDDSQNGINVGVICDYIATNTPK